MQKDKLVRLKKFKDYNRLNSKDKMNYKDNI